MNPEDLKVLAERASTVEGRPDARLGEVHARIRAARRRRTFAAVGATAVAVVVALTAGTALLSVTDSERTPPANPPPPAVTPSDPPEAPEGEAHPLRPLVYVSGSTGLDGGTKVHVGDRTVNARRQVHTIEAVDNGAVFVTGPRAQPGESDVWFTDGSEPIFIGRTFGSGQVDFPITSADAGSLVGWRQPLSGQAGDGELVVYDTAKRRELARFGSGDSIVLGVYDDAVYWLPDQTWCSRPDPDDACRRYGRVMRFDATAGEQARVTWTSYQAELAGRPRVLAAYPVGDPGNDGRLLLDRSHFVREGQRLIPGDEGLGTRYTLRESRTGQEVRLRLPASYESADDFHLVQWLDDDRFTLVSGFYGRGEPTDGDILTCRISTGRCRLVLNGPESTLNLMPGLM